ncbi:MAG: helix-turn-helix transcriptional regulator [Desulfamplus sp.]|nr:helix-turn-helix transcriptional regulator [Desulfamplus sp.]
MYFNPKKITELREKQGLSRENLADLAGLSYNAIWRIEESSRVPSVDTLGLIAKALNTRNINQFFDQEQPAIAKKGQGKC